MYAPTYQEKSTSGHIQGIIYYILQEPEALHLSSKQDNITHTLNSFMLNTIPLNHRTYLHMSFSIH